jgi:hypothetical protein
VSRPPERDPQKRAAQRQHWRALESIESHRPQPKPKPPLDPKEWAKLLELKRAALAEIEQFRPWWLTP